MLEKGGEKATEVILAKDVGDDPRALAAEVADLWFQTLVMLTHLNLDSAAVLECLQGVPRLAAEFWQRHD
ncbi:phosphoribosyl-ATP pyrophosphatase [Kineobactrum salinum]|uniref:phosphoribosyl-ATP pyrophosphatase n=1 Tax=Kineobactrum salinum TaxID=2708301 RepID=UPI0038CC1376